MSPAVAQDQIEATLDAVRDKLESGLPDKLAQINAEHDDLVLTEPAAITVGIKQDLNFPRIFVLPGTTDLLTEASGRIYYRHRVALVSYVAAWDEGELTRYLLRYQRAVREVALAGRKPFEGPGPGPGGYSMNFERDEYGSHFQLGANAGDLTGQFVQFARSTFIVQQQQDL